MVDSVTLYLYRHGNTFDSGDKIVQVGIKSDLCLTRRGEEQANVFGQYLQQQKISPSHIYSGSLQRQTKSLAQLKAYCPSAKYETHIGALDEIDYGLWEGLTAEDIAQRWPESAQSWQQQAQWPIEIFQGSQQTHTDRLLEFFAVLRQYQSQSPFQSPQVLISSNGIIRYFLYFSSQWASLVASCSMLEFKVKTGHFCKLRLEQNNTVHMEEWNIAPFT